MSASERLAALDSATETIALCLRNPVIPNIYDADARDALDLIRNALPEIVAVVRAAEEFFPEHLEVLRSDLPRALAALDAKLESE